MLVDWVLFDSIDQRFSDTLFSQCILEEVIANLNRFSYLNWIGFVLKFELESDAH